MKKIILLLVIIFSSNLIAKENFSIKLSLKNGDNTQNDKMMFGLNTEATDGIDIGIGESEIPPCPGAFQCSSFEHWDSVAETYVLQYIDYKNFPLTIQDSVEFKFRYWDVVTAVDISWEALPKNVTFARLRSFYHVNGYNDIDMLTTNTIKVTNPLLNLFRIVLKYDDNQSVEENSEQITIYPNPISQSFYINSNNRVTLVKIIDLMGNEILTIEPESNYIDISKINSGTYYLKIIDELNHQSVKKIIKI